MSTVIESIEQRTLKQRPRFGAGDRVRVHFQVVEGNRQRTQVFEGIVIKRQGSGARETFTVRKNSFGVGVERTFPLHSPKIEQLEVAARGDVRRAKLYYLREKVGQARPRRRAALGDRGRAGDRRARGRGGRLRGRRVSEAEPEVVEPEVEDGARRPRREASAPREGEADRDRGRREPRSAEADEPRARDRGRRRSGRRDRREG